jgi:hypothetical protein
MIDPTLLDALRRPAIDRADRWVPSAGRAHVVVWRTLRRASRRRQVDDARRPDPDGGRGLRGYSADMVGLRLSERAAEHGRVRLSHESLVRLGRTSADADGSDAPVA